MVTLAVTITKAVVTTITIFLCNSMIYFIYETATLIFYCVIHIITIIGVFAIFVIA